jgi:MFS family permease
VSSVAAQRGAPRVAWVVVAGGTFAYLCAVTQRSTMGVAGVAAADRFQSSAAALSTLTVLQLVVYAALQVPIGVLVDRLGPKVVLATGAVLMICGQVLVAQSTTLDFAVCGRILVGAGDATTFISVLRLVNAWFEPRRVPVLSQWVGNVGGAGQVLSAVPFSALLRTGGWTDAFLTAAGLGGVGLVVILLLVRNGPHGAQHGAATMRGAVTALGMSIRRPGTQLGFWSHFVTQSSGVVFALFWGYPFLVSATGLPATTAATLLSLQVVSAIVVGPVLGVLTARFPLRRSNLVLGIVVLMGVVWTVVLAWPGVPPLWLLTVLVVVIGAGGPGSQIGFDYARTFNPVTSLGSANGVVNVGGFTASFTMMLAIGVILDAVHAAVPEDGLYSLTGFRIAFCVQYVVIGFGVAMLLHARHRTRRRMEDLEGISVGPVWVALVRAARRRRSEIPTRTDAH